MDLNAFWSNIRFRFSYKEKGYFVMTAHVDSGTPVELRVVSRNKAENFCQMDWILVYGTPPTRDSDRAQFFNPPHNINPVLDLHDEGNNKAVYVHKFEPYTVTRILDPHLMNMSLTEEHLRLVEAISTPSFTIKKLRQLSLK
jgi:hypothetical protein